MPLHKVVLGGFSQGAMTATDAALSMPPGASVGHVLHLSGAPIVVEEWALKLKVHPKINMLVTHGTQDATLPFAVSGWARDLFTQGGATVEYVAHSGGHELGDNNVIGKIGRALARVANSR